MESYTKTTRTFTVDQLFDMNECDNGAKIRNKDGYLKKYLPDDWSDFKHNILTNGLTGSTIQIRQKDNTYTIIDGIHRIIAMKELQNEGLLDKNIKIHVELTLYKPTPKLKDN